MAAEERATVDPVKVRSLLAQASQRGFFPTIAFLEQVSNDAVPVGRDGPPSQESIRLRHDPSLAFPAGEIREAQVRSQLFEVVSTFLGLTGSMSPLPLFMSAEVAHEELHGGLMSPFLDIFHHRILSLLFRQWARYRLGQELDSGYEDAWSKRLQGLLGSDAYANIPSALSAQERLYLAPIFASRARTAHGLVQMLTATLSSIVPNIRIHIRQLAGARLPLGPGQQMELNTETAVLGRSAVVGRYAPDCASRFVVTLEGLPVSRSSEFRPGGAQHKRIASIVADFVRDPLEFELQLQFEGDGIAGFALSRLAASTLGRQTFLKGRSAGGQVVTHGLPANP